jgi:hypothetical protein
MASKPKTILNMKKLMYLLSCSLFLTAFSSHLTLAQDMAMNNTVTVGGEAMYPQKNIIENAVNSKNDAFENLPAGTVETLLKPENKEMLTKILTYHVISGKHDYDAIAKAIKAGKGKATLKTVSGGTLTAMMNGSKNISVKDEKGNVANITTYDVNQSNGVIHVLDAVVLPN